MTEEAMTHVRQFVANGDHVLKTIEILQKVLKKVPEAEPILQHYLSTLEIGVKTKDDGGGVTRILLYVKGVNYHGE